MSTVILFGIYTMVLAVQVASENLPVRQCHPRPQVNRSSWG